MALHAVYETKLSGLTLIGRGKVRDIYEVNDKLLLVASDRLSAFDVVLPDGIPDKGKVLTQISAFWFRKLADIVPNHMISVDVMDFPPATKIHEEALAGRSMLCIMAKPLPVECVVRGYLSGSGWAEYRERGEICGIPVTGGLPESARLPEPIFTPATKEEKGKHDMNIPFAKMVDIVGKEIAEKARAISLEIYRRAADYARGRGIIIADTKFEFGFDGDGRIVWMDEALTPDSSRFWPADDYEPGRSQSSFDKQYVRDWLEASGWDKEPPAPTLPPEVVDGTLSRYRDAYRMLTGEDLSAVISSD